MRVLLITLILVTSLICYSCDPTDYCDPTTPIKFRGISVAFPQSGLDVYNKEKVTLFRRGAQLYSDSTWMDSRVRWFLYGDSDHLTNPDTVKYLETAKLFGVTFSFKNDSISEKELVKELETQLNIKLDYTEKPARTPYYLYENGCLAIMVHHLEHEKYPLVSFCYGLGDSELMYYAGSPGNRWFD